MEEKNIFLNIQKFSTLLNKSISTEYKINHWNNYRNQIKSFIGKNIHNKKEKKIIVLGAGDCGDINLKFFKNNFKKVLLTDIDKNALKRGIKKQNISNINYSTIDYTGLDNINFYEKLIALLNKGKEIKKVKNYIDSSLENIKIRNLINMLQYKFEVVLSLPIYTQFFYQHFQTLINYYEIYKKYNSTDISEISTFMLNKTKTVIKNYNYFIKEITTENGRIIALLDMLEYKSESKEIKKIKKLQTLKKRHEKDKFIKILIKKSGFGIPNFALKNLNDIFSERKSKWLLWNFDENRTFIVKIILFQKII